MKQWYYYIDRKGKVGRTSDPEKWLTLKPIWSWHIVDVVDRSIVSTTFLGIDFSLGMSKQPVLFETMIIKGKRNKETHRYITQKEAEQGHATIVKELMAEWLNKK